MVSNVDVKQALKYSRNHYIVRKSDWSQLIRCADLILWLQSVIEFKELQYLIPQCANCLVCCVVLYSKSMVDTPGCHRCLHLSFLVVF